MRRGDRYTIFALVVARVVPGRGPAPERVADRLRGLLVPALRRLDGGERRALRSRLRGALSGAPEVRRRLAEELIALLGVEALVLLAPPAAGQSARERRRAVVLAIDAEPTERESVLAAAIRRHLGRADEADAALLRRFLARLTHSPDDVATPSGDGASHQPLPPREEEPQDFSSTEDTMATFYHDKSGLPAALAALDTGAFEKAFTQPVADRLSQITGTAPDEVTLAAVTGMLLLDEQFTPTASTFDDAVKSIYFEEILGSSTDIDGDTVRNREVLTAVRDEMTGGDADRRIGYRQFASVGRYVIGRLGEIPLGHPDFEAVVAIGVERFIGGRPRFESLELPPLATDEGVGTEIEADNVRAVGLIYAAQQLEQMRLFDVVDRIVELFMNGLLAIRFGNAGRRLDRYYWDNEDRMDRAARAMVFARVLGSAGDVSREVQPNLPLANHMLGFMSHCSEYDRQRRIADLIDSAHVRRLSLTSERIRKSGRDFGANMSLYGYASAHFSARRLNAHVEDAFAVLNEPEVQQVFGVSNPYQAIEQVTSREFGTPVNVVRHHTLAVSGKRVIDIIAKHSRVWARLSARPLFSENGGEADIPNADRDELLRHAEYWLAVNGVSDADVDRYAQPGQSALAPSIPAYGRGGMHGSNGDGTVDRLRAMVESGEQPSMDQLRGLLQV